MESLGDRSARPAERAQPPPATTSPAPSSTPATPVIAFGAGITLLGVMRALHRAGVPAYAVSMERDYVHLSRHVRPPPAALPADSSQQELEAFLQRLPLDQAVLIGCSDTWALRVSSLSAGLRQRFRSSTCAPEVLDTFVDKLHLAAAARAADVLIPYTEEVGLGHPVDNSLFEQRDRLFLKPRHSEAFQRDYGVKGLWVRSPAEFHERLQRTHGDGHQVILQEYIAGSSSDHYFIDGFVDARGRVIAKLARRRIRMYPTDFGNSTCTCTVPLEEIDDAGRAIDRILAHVGYHGVFSAEFVRDQRDGYCRLLEINPRPWWYVEFAARCGVDVCHLAYRDALGEALEPVQRYEIGRWLVHPQIDWPACRELRRHGKLRVKETLRHWITADQPLCCWSDPVPGVAELTRFAGNRLKRIFRSAPTRSV